MGFEGGEGNNSADGDWKIFSFMSQIQYEVNYEVNQPQFFAKVSWSQLISCSCHKVLLI